MAGHIAQLAEISDVRDALRLIASLEEIQMGAVMFASGVVKGVLTFEAGHIASVRVTSSGTGGEIALQFILMLPDAVFQFIPPDRVGRIEEKDKVWIDINALILNDFSVTGLPVVARPPERVEKPEEPQSLKETVEIPLVAIAQATIPDEEIEAVESAPEPAAMQVPAGFKDDSIPPVGLNNLLDLPTVEESAANEVTEEDDGAERWDEMEAFFGTPAAEAQSAAVQPAQAAAPAAEEAAVAIESPPPVVAPPPPMVPLDFGLDETVAESAQPEPAFEAPPPMIALDFGLEEEPAAISEPAVEAPPPTGALDFGLQQEAVEPAQDITGPQPLMTEHPQEITGPQPAMMERPPEITGPQPVMMEPPQDITGPQPAIAAFAIPKEIMPEPEASPPAMPVFEPEPQAILPAMPVFEPEPQAIPPQQPPAEQWPAERPKRPPTPAQLASWTEIQPEADEEISDAQRWLITQSGSTIPAVKPTQEVRKPPPSAQAPAPKHAEPPKHVELPKVEKIAEPIDYGELDAIAAPSAVRDVSGSAPARSVPAMATPKKAGMMTPVILGVAVVSLLAAGIFLAPSLFKQPSSQKDSGADALLRMAVGEQVRSRIPYIIDEIDAKKAQ